jgi:hypothetical protein
MRLFVKACGAALFLGLILGLMGAISGCDAAGGRTEYRTVALANQSDRRICTQHSVCTSPFLLQEGSFS